ALGAWIFGRWQRARAAGAAGFAAAGAAAAVLAVAAAAALAPGYAAPASEASSTAPGARVPDQPWSAERLAAARAQGRPVFVNFTAAWCVSCQVNERVALSTETVARAFAAS